MQEVRSRDHRRYENEPVSGVTETRGGTGQSTYNTGDILYASAEDTLSRLAIGNDTEVLTIAAGLPTWAVGGGGGGGGGEFDSFASPTYPDDVTNDGVWYGDNTKDNNSGQFSVSLGNNAHASGIGATAVGSISAGYSDYVTHFGTGGYSGSGAPFGTSMGFLASVGHSSVVLGRDTLALTSSLGHVCIGRATGAGGNRTITIGHRARGPSTETLSIGHNAYPIAQNHIAIGADSLTTATFPLALTSAAVPAASVAGATHKLPVKLNGADYWFLVSNVAP